MLINRDDPRFWDMRTRDRRIRRGELTLQDVEAHLMALPEVGEKATISVPLEEPDERARERRAAANFVRATMPPPSKDDDFDDLDDLDDEDDEDEDDDDEDDDDEDDEK